MRSRRTRRAAAAAVALLLTAVSLVTGPGPASAVPTAGDVQPAAAYDGTDPESTGCANSAYTARSAYGSRSGTSYLLIELRYSPTCRTAWARITTLNLPTCIPGADYCGHATVHRNSDGREYRCSTPRGGRSCYTRQVNDANVTSYAFGDVDHGAWTTSARTGSY